MNFVSKFDANLPADGLGSHFNAHSHAETVSAHTVPSDAIVVPDAQLLFNGDFKRSGVDLILSKDHQELVLQDYFKGEKRAALSSPDGAHLTGDIVSALTGHVDYAQAGGAPDAGRVIGHVSKLVGSATAVRNGVSIILNNGDNVEKGDVVQSGSESTLGITFIDGTVFGLSSNARMVLNEMVYDPNGSSNSSLLSLVAGTISFVAGETAKHGDMKIDTPVATMGIRGTAVLVEIDFQIPLTGTPGPDPNLAAPTAKFQVLVEPDGHTGSYILFDKTTLTPIATVDQAGQQINISQGQVSITNSPLSPDLQKLITDVFSLKFTDNTNPQKLQHYTDSVAPQTLMPIILANGTSATPVIQVVNQIATSQHSGPSGPSDPSSHIDGPPTAVAFGNSVIELTGVTHSSAIDSASGKVNFVDINAGDAPTVTTAFSAFTYQNAAHNDVTATLNAQQLADIKAVEVNLVVVPDASNNNNGSATWTYSVADGAFDFLAAGETLTLTYIARIDNNYAPNDEATPKPFTLTITGTNDVPVITTGPESVAYSGGKTTVGGNLQTVGGVPTTGTLAFTDVDLSDTHTVAKPMLADASMSGGAKTLGLADLEALAPTPMGIFGNALSASVSSDSTGTGSGTITWNLADLPVYLADFIPVGEVLTLTYTVTVTDSQGAIATQNVTVTVTGTDTAAVVWIDTTPAPPGGALWSDPSNWETGTVPTSSDDAIVITNQLNPLTPTSPVLTPTYPALINAAAAAQSLTMNDFSDLTDPHHPQPHLINQSTLTIGTGGISLSADSWFENFGTIDVGGAMKVQDSSVLHNAGVLNLAQGGDFTTTHTIANDASGTIDVTGGTLNVEVAVTNAGTLEATGIGEIILSNETVTNITATDPITNKITSTGTVNVVGSGATLNLEGAAITGGIVDNSGTLKATSGTSTISGVTTFTNSGTLEAIGGATLLLGGETVDNSSGTVTVDSGSTLNLESATISGGIVDNSGTIEATSGTDTISGTSSFTNDGTLEAINGSTLKLISTTVTGAATGVATAGASSHIDLQGATLLQHTVSTAVSGEIDTVSGSSNTINTANGQFDLSGRVNNLGTLAISDHSALTLESAAYINNPGTIELNSTGDNTYLYIDQGFAGFDGGGHVTLSDDTHNIIAATSSGQQLTNLNNTISGAGDIGQGGLVLVNNGVIDANGQNALKLDPLSLTNTGTLEATNGATLLINSTTVTNDSGSGNTLVNGTIAAIGTNAASHSSVGLQDATINGGTISITAQGAIVATSGINTISGAASITNSASTLEANGAELDLVHSTVTNTTVNGNTGIVYVTGTNGSIKLEDATISGGAVDTTDASDTVEATSGTNSIDNAATISNAGTLAANGGTLTVDFAGTFTNTGLVESIQHGLLVLSHVALSNTDDADDPVGTVTVTSDSTLNLDAATITGGTLTNGGTVNSTGASALTGVGINNTGTIEATSGMLTIDPAPLANSGTLEANGGELDLTGETVTNTGTLQAINASTLKLTDTTVNDNDGVATDPIGAVTVGNGSTLDLARATINGGTINDGTAGGTGSINVTDSSTISGASLNHGSVAVTIGETLTLDDDTVNGTTITASGAFVQIDGNTTLTLNGATFNGGTINDYSAGTASGSIVAGDIDVTGDSTIENAILNNGGMTIATGKTLTLDNDTVTGTAISDAATGAILQVDDGDTLKLSGVTINGGTLNDGTSSGATIEITGSSAIKNASLNHGGITVDGGVTLTLDNDTVTGTTFTDTATGAILQVDDGDALKLSGVTINGGTLNDGTSSGATIEITGSSTIENAGLNDGGITVDGGVTLTLDNDTVTGTAISGADATSIIQVDGNTALKLNGATFNGGTINDYSANAASGSIVAGDIDVTGDSTIENAILNNGDVTIESGKTLTLDNDTVNGTTFTDVSATGSIIQIDDGTTLTLSGVTINGGTINDGTAGGTGTPLAFGSLAIAGSSKISGAILNNGGVTIASGKTLTLDNDTVTGTAFSDPGTIKVEADKTLTLAGTDTITGGQFAFGEGKVALANGGGIVLSGVSIGNLKAGNPQVTLTIKADSGSLTALSTSDLTVVENGSNGTIEVTGLLAEINAALAAGLIYDPVGISNKLTLTIDDGLGDTAFRTLTVATPEAGSPSFQVTDASGAIRNANLIDITGTTTLSSDQVFNGSGNLKVEAGGLLKLIHTGTHGGTITDDGTIEITGHTGFNGGSLNIDANGFLVVDSTKLLTLNNMTVTGGTVTDNGTIEIIGSSAINGAQLSHGGVTVDAHQTLTLDGTMLIATTITGTDLTSIVHVDSAQTLTLNGATISGGTLTNAGTIQSTGDTAITDAGITNTGTIEATGGILTVDPGTLTNHATISANGGEIDITGEPVANTGTLQAIDGGTLKLTSTTVDNTGVNTDGTVEVGSGSPLDLPSTLDLVGATINTGTLNVTGTGTLDATGTNAINGVAITNSGTFEVTGGTTIIDAASSVSSTGTFEVNGGSLIVDGTLSGIATIVGASLLELGANSAAAYSSASIVFAAAATGTLQLDHADAFQGTYTGLTISGLDDNTLDLRDIAYGANVTVSYTGTAAGGTLSIFENGTDVSDIHLSGDYLGAHWALANDWSTQHGTDVTEIPGAITAGLDSHGNASEGGAVTAIITDGGQSVTDPTYDWQIFDSAQGWIEGSGTGGASATYTPGETDEGHALRVSLTFTDANGHTDSTTVSAGTVNPVADQPVVTASAAAIDEDGTSALTLTLTNAADLFENSDDSLTLTVTLDNGATLLGAGVTDNGNGSFTLTAASVGDLNGLTITPASEFEGTVAIGVSAVTHDGTAVSAAGTASTTLTVNPVADQPVVTAAAAAIDEDGTSALTLTLANATNLFEGSDDRVTLTVRLDNGATLHGSGVTDNHDGTFTLTAHAATDLNGLTITPASEFEGTVAIGVSAVTHDGSNDSSIGSTTASLTVNPVADAPALAALHVNDVSDSLIGNSIDDTKWNVFLPTGMNGTADASVTPTASGAQLHDHGYLQSVAGFTPTAATPLHISLSFTLTANSDYVAVTDGTNGAIDNNFASPANGLSFMANWNGNFDVVDASTGQQTGFGTGNLGLNTLYDVSITDDGSHQTFMVINDATGLTVVSGSTNYTNPRAGTEVTITDREGSGDAGGPHTSTVSDVTISNAYHGPENGTVTLGRLTGLIDTDGTDTLALKLSGFPAGATFSVGALGTGPDAGLWVISATQLASLTSPLTMTPPVDYNGNFTLHVDAVVTDPAAGVGTDTKTFTNDFAVTVDAVNDATFSLNGLTNNNAVEGQQITAVVTDADAPASGISYDFQTLDGAHWNSVQTGNNASYTPTEADEGSQLRVNVSYSDTHGNAETGTVAAGTVQESATDDLVATLNATSAAEGAQINVVGVTDGSLAAATTGLTYAWQVSTDGMNWTTVSANSFYAPSEADEGKSLQLVTTYADQPAGNTEQTINSLGAVADIAPTLTAPFSVAIDEFKIVKGSAVFDDTFGQAPPVGGTFGASPVSFTTIGSTWTDLGGKAIMSSAGVVILPGYGAQVIARLQTNTQDQSVSTGLKENSTFAVSATFDLATSLYSGDQYGINLTDATATHANDEMVQLYVMRTVSGGEIVKLVQTNFSIGSFTTLASYTLTASDLQNNNQIRLDLAHLSAGTSAITGSFELLNNGTQTSPAQTFTPTGHVFDNVSYTRADIFAFAPQAVAITGTAQEGQTLTAHTSTNDSDATIHYQWQSSGDGTTWNNVGTDNAQYILGEVDEGFQIRVKATTSDSDNTVSVTSNATAAVQESATENATISLTGLDGNHNAVQGQQVTATVTDPDAPASGILYTWTVNGVIVHTGTDANGASYAPTAADQGLAISVAASFNDTHHNAETGLQSAGTVAAPPVVYAIASYANFSNNFASAAPPSANVGNGANDGVTLDGWVDWNGGGPSQQVLFFNGNTSDSGFGLNGDIVNGKLVLNIGAGGQGSPGTVFSLNANEWYNLALTRVNGAYTLYVNDVEVFTGGGNVNSIPGAVPPDNLMVGGIVDGTQEFSGSIADVNAWNVALTQSQVASTNFTSLAGTESGLVGYWPLNDGSGSTGADHSADGHNLSFSTAPTWVSNGAGVSTNENTALTLKTLNVTFADAGNDTMTATLGVAHGTLSLGSTAGVGMSGVGTSASPLLLTGTLSAIDAALASGVMYVPTNGYTGADTLSVQASDGTLHSNTANVAINVAAVAPNAAPVLAISASATVNFDGLDASGGAIGGAALDSYLAGYGITISASSGADSAVADDRAIYGGGIVNATSGHNVVGENGGHPVSYTATFAHALTSFAFDRVQENAGPSGSSYPLWSATAYDAAGNVLSTVSEAEHIVFGSPMAAAHYVLSGAGIDHVTFTGNDQGHDGFANVLTDTWVLNGTTALVTNEDTPLTINGITVSDSDAGTAQIEVTLAAAHGTLVLGSVVGLDNVVGSGTGSVNLFGSQAAIDTALASGIAYTPGSDYSGSDTLTVIANDQGHISSGGAQSMTQHIALTVTPSSDALTIATDHFSVIDNGDGTTTVNGLAVSDADATSGETFTINAVTEAAGSGTSVTASTSLPDTGLLTQINGDLAGGVIYHPGATPPLTDKVTFSVADSFGATDTVNFVFNQAGSGPNITLTGTAGKDVIFATGNQDTLTGGGGLDQFVFKPTSGTDTAQHTITDFITGLDKIDIRQFSTLSASNLPTETQQGSDTLITLDSHDTVLLKNVIATHLSGSDFILHG